MNCKTRATAGAASKSARLTHSVDLDTGLPLCSRVKAANVLDDEFVTDEDAAPTCLVCAKRDPRFK